jgi:hypothetical protein
LKNEEKTLPPLPKEGENNMLEFPSCSVSWLALPFWGGMGEAPMFFSKKVSAVRLVIERC